MSTKEPFWEQRQKYDLVPLLATAKQLADREGFVSKNESQKLGCPSTGDKVREIFRRAVLNLEYIDIKVFPTKIQTYVNDLMEWVINTDNITRNLEYNQNVKDVYNLIQVADKQVPLAVSTIGIYDRALSDDGMNELTKNSVHVGVVGERDDFFFKLIDIKNGDGWVLYKCITKERNLCSFFRNSDAEQFEVELGDCFLVKATPKNHEEYKGTKQTTFNRVVFMKNYGQPT